MRVIKEAVAKTKTCPMSMSRSGVVGYAASEPRMCQGSACLAWKPSTGYSGGTRTGPLIEHKEPHGSCEAF